jgi:hypothetical protein
MTRRLPFAFAVALLLLVATGADAAICCLRCVSDLQGVNKTCKDPSVYTKAPGEIICPCEVVYDCMPSSSGTYCVQNCDGEPCLWA